MERFKACEKEAKNKGPGAGRAADADPKQRAKDEARDWINNCVDTMTEKVRKQTASIGNPSEQWWLPLTPLLRQRTS